MGGAAAKQRRKEQRQHLQPPEGTFDDDNVNAHYQGSSKGKGKRQDRDFNRARHNHQKFVQTDNTKKSNPGHNPTFANKPFANASAKPKGNKTEKKFKKPKHLKRKLETAEDEQTKEQLLRVLQEFEQKKTKPSSKKPRLSSSSTAAVAADTAKGKTNLNHNDAPALEEEATTTKKDFPRSLSSKNTGAKKPTTKKQISDKKSSSDSDSDSESSSDKEKEKQTRKKSAMPPQKQAAKPSPDASGEDGSSSTSGMDSNDDKPSSDKDEDDSSSSDEEEENEGGDPQQTRTRGKRRRGRKSTSQVVEEKAPTTTSKTEKMKSTEEKQQQNDDTSKRGERYCVGRKPVTDFIINQEYPGRVVYMKPFGIFLDIGCHSDAFCHISRLHDDYVEKPEDLFQPGDSVPAARVIEVDRKHKRITVSLQSKARLPDERKSIEARRQRKQKGPKSTKHTSPSHHQDETEVHQHPQHQHHFDGQEEDAKPQQPTHAVSKNMSVVVETRSNKPESEMTPAELKRARKLARRAARRAERGEGNDPSED